MAKSRKKDIRAKQNSSPSYTHTTLDYDAVFEEMYGTNIEKELKEYVKNERKRGSHSFYVNGILLFAILTMLTILLSIMVFKLISPDSHITENDKQLVNSQVNEQVEDYESLLIK